MSTGRPVRPSIRRADRRRRPDGDTGSSSPCPASVSTSNRVLPGRRPARGRASALHGHPGACAGRSQPGRRRASGEFRVLTEAGQPRVRQEGRRRHHHGDQERHERDSRLRHSSSTATTPWMLANFFAVRARTPSRATTSAAVWADPIVPGTRSFFFANYEGLRQRPGRAGVRRSCAERRWRGRASFQPLTERCSSSAWRRRCSRISLSGPRRTEGFRRWDRGLRGRSGANQPRGLRSREVRSPVFEHPVAVCQLYPLGFRSY